jgi:hypothetical protein
MGVGSQHHVLAALSSGKSRNHFTRGWLSYGAGLQRHVKSSGPTRFDPRTVVIMNTLSRQPITSNSGSSSGSGSSISSSSSGGGSSSGSSSRQHRRRKIKAFYM